MSKKKRDIPLFDRPIIETHCHLDYLEGDELSDTLAETSRLNIERMVTISVSPDNLSKVRALTANEAVWGTQGIHPHDAEKYSDAVHDELLAHGSDEKIVAIGEIGLDYYYDHADRTVQQRVFERQLQVATELNQPIVVHTREADEDTAAIIKNALPGLTRRGVIHSFTSGMALAEYCLSEGFMLGFNGIITFNKAENVRDVLAATPLDRILVETDSPYLTPVPYRGKPNSPKYIPFVVEKIAEVKQVPVDAVLEATYHNALQLFSW